MSTSDPNEVEALRARIAELEGQGGQTLDPPPEHPVLPGVDEKSTEERDLEAELAKQRAHIEDLTRQLQAQNDPATADPSLDVSGLLNEFRSAQVEYRNEIAALREEVAKARRQPIPSTAVTLPTAEELAAKRQSELEQHSHYCPACGKLYDRPRECTGDPASPHPAVEVVSTDEVKDPPDPKDKEAVAAWQQGHTAMEYVDPHLNELLVLHG